MPAYEPFNPVQRMDPPWATVELVPEQEQIVRDILFTACSDSRFAEKAYNALQMVLHGLLPNNPGQGPQNANRSTRT